jgi:hypothetical protein
MGGTHKAEASRANGKKSRGPTSVEGKSRARMNALKSGLFARAIVIPSAGETQKEFDKFRAAAWDQFEPQDVSTAMLVEEIVISYWRLARARRCEAGEIRKRLETAKYRWQNDRIARADSLKSAFIRQYAARYAYRTGAEQLDPVVITASIEEARVQLKQSAAGLEFLTDMIKSIQLGVEVLGYIDPEGVTLLVDACGIEDQFAKRCMMLNQIAEAEMAKIKNDRNVASTFDLNKDIFLMNFGSEIRRLTSMTKLLERLEQVEEEAHLATLVLPAPEAADRVHRAEAAHQRSFYRALDRLMEI